MFYAKFLVYKDKKMFVPLLTLEQTGSGLLQYR